MEKKLSIKNFTGAGITALIYLPPKREVVAGFEDGMMRCWELESGRPTCSSHKHKGWVSQLLYWPEGKVMFSCSIDSTIVQWSSSFEPYFTIELPGPVYCLMWSPRKDQLICGRKNCLGIISLSGKMATNGLPLISPQELVKEGHTDIVKCVTGYDNKAYSAGFDRRLFVYEVSNLPGAPPLRNLNVNHHAHDAGITCMLVSRDMDNNTWLATGSYDQIVKIWTAEGKIMMSISCQSVVTGLCYVHPTRVLWVAAGGRMPVFIEPKIGVNISQFVPVLGEGYSDKHDKSKVLQSITYFPEINEVLGFSNLKEILTWKYTTYCSVCIQHSPSSSHIETITYTNKSPVLIFTASYDGIVTKWERHQLNNFVYIQDTLTYHDRLMEHLYSEESEWNMLDVVGKGVEQDTPTNLVIADSVKENCRQELLNEDYRGFVTSLFVEKLNYLVVSSLDGKIFVWGYDEQDMHMLLQMMKGTDSASMEDTVTGRVAGLTCTHVLNGHSSAVSGLALVQGDKLTSHLVSVSWDCHICVWDLSQMSLVSRIKHKASSATGSVGDSIIMDTDYSDKYDLIAYSTSESSIVLCPFTKKRTGLKPKVTLKGHNGEVSQIKWNKFIEKWVSGSDDGTIRIWPADGTGGRCDLVVTTGGPVTVITIDQTYGLILAAVGNIIKLYDKELELVQVSKGHTDSIQSILHVPELKLYFSSSWDKTMRIWRAYHPRH